MTRSADSAFQKQLLGWSLTTAEILYHLPDYRDILQTFVWQDYDHAPKFPRLVEFLEYWERNLEGPLHSVRIAHASIIGPHEFRHVDAVWQLH
jgi:uncharacterized protein Usg